jgi:glycopeptide antibiotics resistance protein
MKTRIALAIILLLYILFLLDIALFRFQATNPKPNWVPFRMIMNDWRYGGLGFVVNFLGNLVAFLPMGALPPLIRTRRTALWQVALFSFLISFMIEAGQYVSGRRVPDVDDLILNTLGGVLGYLALRLGGLIGVLIIREPNREDRAPAG